MNVKDKKGNSLIWCKKSETMFRENSATDLNNRRNWTENSVRVWLVLMPRAVASWTRLTDIGRKTLKTHKKTLKLTYRSITVLL